MSGDILLSVDGLSVHIGSRSLLRDISFSLQPGEALTLLGESGAGKSLLAQAISTSACASSYRKVFSTEGSISKAWPRPICSSRIPASLAKASFRN